MQLMDYEGGGGRIMNAYVQELKDKLKVKGYVFSNTNGAHDIYLSVFVNKLSELNKRLTKLEDLQVIEK